jgi:hypothetical protein
MLHWPEPISGSHVQSTLDVNPREGTSLDCQRGHAAANASGEWLIARYLETNGAIDIEVMKQLKSNSRRKVIVPSRADLDNAELAFKSVQPWTAVFHTLSFRFH